MISNLNIKVTGKPGNANTSYTSHCSVFSLGPICGCWGYGERRCGALLA